VTWTEALMFILLCAVCGFAWGVFVALRKKP
jgi:uncharacterized protein YneF (UPF0154 family)